MFETQKVRRYDKFRKEWSQSNIHEEQNDQLQFEILDRKFNVSVKGIELDTREHLLDTEKSTWTTTFCLMSAKIVTMMMN